MDWLCYATNGKSTNLRGVNNPQAGLQHWLAVQIVTQSICPGKIKKQNWEDTYRNNREIVEGINTQQTMCCKNQLYKLHLLASTLHCFCCFVFEHQWSYIKINRITGKKWFTAQYATGWVSLTKVEKVSRNFQYFQKYSSNWKQTWKSPSETSTQSENRHTHIEKLHKGSYGHTPAAECSCRRGREEARGLWSTASAHRPQSPGHTHYLTEDPLLHRG